MLGATTGRDVPEAGRGPGLSPHLLQQRQFPRADGIKQPVRGRGAAAAHLPAQSSLPGHEGNHMAIFPVLHSTRLLPREAACSRQFPSPVVARGSSRWQLGSTFAHQFRRPGEISESVKTGPVNAPRDPRVHLLKKKKKDEECSLLGLRGGRPRMRAACPVCAWKKGATERHQKGQSVGTWGGGWAARTGRKMQNPYLRSHKLEKKLKTGANPARALTQSSIPLLSSFPQPPKKTHPAENTSRAPVPNGAQQLFQFLQLITGLLGVAFSNQIPPI